MFALAVFSDSGLNSEVSGPVSVGDNLNFQVSDRLNSENFEQAFWIFEILQMRHIEMISEVIECPHFVWIIK